MRKIKHSLFVICLLVVAIMLSACGKREAYHIQNDEYVLHLYQGDKEIGTVEVLEECEFAASIDEYVSVWYMNDGTILSEREIFEDDGYELVYVEVSVAPSPAMQEKGESDVVEYHYYFYNHSDYFVDVMVEDEQYCTEALEEYLKEYLLGNEATTLESNDSTENATQEEVVVNGPYGSIQMTIDDSWEYEICNVDDDKLMYCAYGIRLKPAAEAEGYIEVGYCDSFGVCGTGLETKIIPIANGEAHIGYYDGSDNWEFITWNYEELENIVVLSNADWGSAYLDELVAMLNSIQYDRDNQEGGIGVYAVSSELGIDDGDLLVSAKHVSSTSATLIFNYSIYRANEDEKQEELYFGPCLPMAKKVGENWVPLDYVIEDTPSFEDIAYIIKENEETTYEYDWEWLYGSLEPGEYQIAIEINSDAFIYAHFILRN